jgi:hypothetical protein
MASVTLQVRDVFPPTTSVGAYKRSNWTATAVPSLGAAPPGSADTSATVASDGTLTFPSLTPSTEYVAGAQVSGTWTFRNFSSGEDDESEELGYAEVTSNQVASSTVYADVTGWSLPVTSKGRPILVIAKAAVSPANSTVNDGGKYSLVRTDTGTTIDDQQFLSYAAGAPGSLSPLMGRISLPLGQSVTVKVQIGTRVGGTATFGASSDLALKIWAIDV